MLFNIIFNLLIVHIVCDFYLQTSSSCVNKIKHSITGKSIWLHVVAVGILSWCAVWSVYGWWLAFWVMFSHLVIDWLKSTLQIKFNVYKLDKKGRLESGDNHRYDLYFFLGDQIMHIGMIVLISYFWYRLNSNWEQFKWFQILLCNHPVRTYSAVALLILLKPVNVFVLQILKSCKLDNDSASEEHDYFHAGALIGYTERSLIFLFVILSQYEAIGFLIAAKSILRYNEASSGNIKSEYVLCGTLLSLTFSLFFGLCVVNLPAL